MLQRGIKPADAAVLAGFSDQSHMTRWFKRTFGVTPAQLTRAWEQYRSRLATDRDVQLGLIASVIRGRSTF